MNVKNLIAALMVAGLIVASSSVVWGTEKEEMRLTEVAGIIVPLAPTARFVPRVERPAILPALYLTLGAVQVWDIHSTHAALKAGAHEANAAAAPFARKPGSMIGLKAATTAGSIFFAERMWKKNRVGAVVMLVAVNGATAAVSMHNMRNARVARAAGLQSR